MGSCARCHRCGSGLVYSGLVPALSMLTVMSMSSEENWAKKGQIWPTEHEEGPRESEWLSSCSSLLSQFIRRRKTLPKHDPALIWEPSFIHCLYLYHISSLNLRREEKKDIYFRGRLQASRLCLTLCNEHITPGDICLSAGLVAFTFMYTIHSKGFCYTQGDTKLEVKPWSKVHGSRSSPISRAFTERWEKESGCVSKG